MRETDVRKIIRDSWSRLEGAGRREGRSTSGRRGRRPPGQRDPRHREALGLSRIRRVLLARIVALREAAQEQGPEAHRPAMSYVLVGRK